MGRHRADGGARARSDARRRASGRSAASLVVVRRGRRRSCSPGSRSTARRSLRSSARISAAPRSSRSFRGARAGATAIVAAAAGDRLLRAAGRGRRVDPAGARHGLDLVSLPAVPVSVVQSVIPITAALIIVAEIAHLVDLLTSGEPRSRHRRWPTACTDRSAATHDDHAAAVRRGARAGADQRADRRVARASSRSSRWCATHGSRSLPNLALVTYNGATNFPLLAIPLFILAGAIMNASGHLAAADRVRVRAGRMDPRRPRAGVDRRVDVLRRDLRIGGRRRRGARLDPDPGDEVEGLSGAVRGGGDVVGGHARGDHPAVDPDDPLRGDGGDLGRAALRRRHRAGRARRLRPDGDGLRARAPLQPAARRGVRAGRAWRAPRARRCGRSRCRSSSSAASSAAWSPPPRARRWRWWRRCSSAWSSTASSTSRT